MTSARADNGGVAVIGDVNGNIITAKTVVFSSDGLAGQNLSVAWDRPIAGEFHLLRWKSSITDLCGREAEFQDLLEWAETGERIRARFVTGPGGAGKTRLAMEFAKYLEGQGWGAGSVDLGKEVGAVPGKKGTLFIVDYPEEDRVQLRFFLKRLSQLEPPSTPIRLLLLTRSTPEFWEKDLIDAKASRLFAGSRAVQLSGLKEEADRYSMFCQAWRKARELEEPEPTVLPAQPDLEKWIRRSPLHALPLFIIACAIQYHHQPDALTLTGSEIIQALVNRELSRMRNESEAAQLNRETLPRLVAMAAMWKRIGPGEMKSLASRPELEIAEAGPYRIVDMVGATGRLTGGFLPSPEPDILAAGLVHKVCAERPDVATEWVWHAVSQTGIGGLERLGRLIYDSDYVLLHKQNRLGSILAQALENHPERCQFVAPLFSKLEDSISFYPAKATTWRTLAEGTSSDCDRSQYLNDLSNALAHLGRYPESLEKIRLAVEIRERLAAEDEQYEPVLAMSLNNMGSRYAQVGLQEEAVMAAERAVKLRRRLAERDPGFRPALAKSLNNLGVRYSTVGRFQEALDAAKEGADIREQLAAIDPISYQTVLANSLNNLGIRYREVGRLKEALESNERAVALYQGLSEANPSVHEPGLAKCLNNVARRYAHFKRFEEALKAAERAVEIRERLAFANPVYEPELADVLENVGDRYWSVGRHNDALQATARSVEIRQRLADSSIASNAKMLAETIENLAKKHSELGRHEEAEKLSRRAAELNHADPVRGCGIEPT